MAGMPLFAHPGRGLEFDRILDKLRSEPWTREHRLYRIDASLTVLTSPVQWFRGIGHGFHAVEETAAASVVRFGATSSPDKAHGFDVSASWRRSRLDRNSPVSACNRRT